MERIRSSGHGEGSLNTSLPGAADKEQRGRVDQERALSKTSEKASDSSSDGYVECIHEVPVPDLSAMTCHGHNSSTMSITGNGALTLPIQKWTMCTAKR